MADKDSRSERVAAFQRGFLNDPSIKADPNAQEQGPSLLDKLNTVARGVQGMVSGQKPTELGQQGETVGARISYPGAAQTAPDAEASSSAPAAVAPPAREAVAMPSGPQPETPAQLSAPVSNFTPEQLQSAVQALSPAEMRSAAESDFKAGKYPSMMHALAAHGSKWAQGQLSDSEE